MTKSNLPKTQSPQTLEALLGSQNIRKRFDDILGKKAAGFVSSIISAVNQNQELRYADPMTVVSAAAVAASLDLPINPNLGFAHIVPYSGRAQFQMGWRGYVQLAQRTGQYRTINVTAVHEGELIRYDKFTGEMEFDENARKSNTVIGYVAYFKLMTGFDKFFYMTVEEVLNHGKRYSKSFDNEKGRWKQDFDAMAMKTVVKMMLNKWAPLSVDMQQAIHADQAIVKESGDYEYVDSPEDDTPIDTSAFDKKLVEPLDKEKLQLYLELGAKINRVSVDRFKFEAANNFEAFWNAFKKWVDKQPGTKKESKQNEQEIKTCPDSLQPVTTEHCNKECKSRAGCPGWE